ncbi:MAG: hypothetical protein JW850_23670 [Thermoflexales bacterium]|nr:hypothetical protein [Thermoflexales bacterium]
MLRFNPSWLIRPRRKRGGLSLLALLASVLACASGCMLSTLVVYFSWNEARQAAALPQPAPAELRTLQPGTRVLVQARLPFEARDDSGLTLFYVERQAKKEGYQTPSPSSQDWQMEQALPASLEMEMADETGLLVQIPPKAACLNAQTVESADDDSFYRHVGYLPGQALTVHGTWEGDGVLTAKTFYAGRVDDYLDELAARPGTSLLSGLVCAGVGLALLVVGLVLGVLGR